jgi:hypothetical protein
MKPPEELQDHRDNPNSGFSTGRCCSFHSVTFLPRQSQSSGCAPSATVTSRLDIGIEVSPPGMDHERGASPQQLASSEFGPGFRCLGERTEDWGRLCLACVAGSRASKLHVEVRINQRSRSRWWKYDRARGRNIPAATRGAKAHVNEYIVRPSAALPSSLERRAFAAVRGCCWVNEGWGVRRVYPSGICAGLLDA